MSAVSREREQADQIAAPLDVLLVDAAQGTAKRFLPNSSSVKLTAKLASSPRATARTVGSLLGELAKITAGKSALEAPPKDPRFTDSAWKHNPFLKRAMQAHLATNHTLEQLVDLADLDWRDDRRVRFFLTNVAEALSPSNVPLVNPVSARTALEYGGLSLLRGAANFVNDMKSAPRIPNMVDSSGFKVGENIAVTPGSVVFRTDVFELIQYRPQTEMVKSKPLLFVPPTINKFYATDLAPGRSMVEFLVQNGQQVFVMSWRNPDKSHADWGATTYVQAVLDAMGACEQVTGSDQTLLIGACSGGILASLTAGYLAATNQLDRLAAFTLLVTVLDNTKAGEAAAFGSAGAAEAAKALSRRIGYLDGNRLAEGFAWLRPGDLIWRYWVNNYLCGNQPPAFDILFWNSDVTRMPAQLHADFIDMGLDNSLTRPAGVSIDGIPIDLSKVDTDTYVLAGISDHITPWQNCYRSVQILGSQSRFVLSRSGHIAALVNPPTNAKASFQVNSEPAADAQEWLDGATREQGSWWPDWAAWLGQRAGEDMPAPEVLGGPDHQPLADAPGTYVLEK
ncbi:MAG: alpha/beta fold hydrolase [Antricoccus sp.]